VTCCTLSPLTITPCFARCPLQIDDYDASTSEFAVTVRSGRLAGTDAASKRLPVSTVLAALAVQQRENTEAAGSSAAMTDGPAGAPSSSAAAPSKQRRGGASKTAIDAAAVAVAVAGTVVLRFARPVLARVEPASAALKEVLKTYTLLRAVDTPPGAAPATGVKPATETPTSAERWPGLRFEPVPGTEGRFSFNRTLDVLEVSKSQTQGAGGCLL
jgi:hypothetical protein